MKERHELQYQNNGYNHHKRQSYIIATQIMWNDMRSSPKTDIWLCFPTPNTVTCFYVSHVN